MPSTLTTPGTIAEYDVVLSISEEAINRQFELLYKTPVDKLALPPPPGMEERGAAPPPPSKYLINHDLEIHIAAPMPGGKSDIDYDEGIFGHIKPPRVSFKESGSENKARVTLEFERVESFNDEDKKDSIFAQWVGRGPNAKIESTTINGWTMSWDVRLGQTNIQDIMTELIHPASSNRDPSSLHPKAVEALTPLANDNFTVSAIFCIFEAAQISSSFQLLDASGKPPGDTFIAEFASKVSTYYSLLQSKIPEGQATPDHPFVLGYGLCQKLPDIAEVQPGADTKSTPRFFIPKSYNVTVTPSGSRFTGGTFNFCILTHRDSDGQPHRDTVRTDPSQNLNAGKLDQTFFDLTRTSNQDGIMAISRDLIFDKFLCREVANTFFIDITEIFKAAMSQGSLQETSSSFEQLLKLDDRPPSYKQKQGARYEGKIEHRILDDKQSVDGYSQFDVSWTSSLQTSPNIEDKDALRRATLTFTSQIKENYDFTNVGLFSNDQLNAHVDMIYKYVLHITPGKGGLIDIVKDDQASSLPEYDSSGKLKLIDTARPDGAYGAYYTTSLDKGAMLKAIDFLFDHTILAAILPKELKEVFKKSIRTVEDSWASKIADIAIAEYEDKWRDGITSVSNKVILPAGNVFSFAGVDIDTEGNMYTHISFNRGTDGVSGRADPNSEKSSSIGHRKANS